MVWDRTTFFHEGLFFDDDEQLAQRCGPFIDDALTMGDPLVVVVTAATRRVLCRALGSSVERHFWMVSPAEGWWRGSAPLTLQAYASAMRPLVGRGRPWRLVGEPIWLDVDHRQVWHRLECACNATFAELPYHSLCLHDLRRLDAGHVAPARRSHPYLSVGSQPVPNPDYVDPLALIPTLEPVWEPAPDHAVAAPVASSHDARVRVRAWEPLAGAPAVINRALVVVSELTTNSIEHGGRPPALRTWEAGGTIMIETSDTGPGFDARLVGYGPPDPQSVHGRGLWIARVLADDLVIRSGPSGTVARALFDRPVPEAAGDRAERPTERSAQQCQDRIDEAGPGDEQTTREDRA